jgi:hypothetical protein
MQVKRRPIAFRVTERIYHSSSSTSSSLSSTSSSSSINTICFFTSQSNRKVYLILARFKHYYPSNDTDNSHLILSNKMILFSKSQTILTYPTKVNTEKNHPMAINRKTIPHQVTRTKKSNALEYMLFVVY